MKSHYLGSGSAVIFVTDIGISRQFYTGVLGLRIKLDFGKNVIFDGFSIWEIRRDHIISEKLGSAGKSGNPDRFELYFETEDIESIIGLLESNQVKLLHDLHEEPWGQRTIRFFDPDNHLIEIGETLKVFIKRFHDKGLSPEEIYRRTSVPVDEVTRLLDIE